MCRANQNQVESEEEVTPVGADIHGRGLRDGFRSSGARAHAVGARHAPAGHRLSVVRRINPVKLLRNEMSALLHRAGVAAARQRGGLRYFVEAMPQGLAGKGGLSLRRVLPGSSGRGEGNVCTDLFPPSLAGRGIVNQKHAISLISLLILPAFG
jgi:hypothetical protein